MLWLIPLAVCISFRLYMCGRPHWSCLSAHGLEKSWNFSLQMKGGIEYSAGPGRTLLLWPLIGRDSLSKDWNELHWHEHAFYCLSSLLRVLPVKPKELCYSVFFFLNSLQLFFHSLPMVSKRTYQTYFTSLMDPGEDSHHRTSLPSLSPLPLGPSISLLSSTPRLGCQSHTHAVEEVPYARPPARHTDMWINKQSVQEHFHKSSWNKS